MNSRTTDSIPLIFRMFGMVYVYYFASFIVLLREVLRPGVLWFLRNLNDPDFSPIQVRKSSFRFPFCKSYSNVSTGNDPLVHFASHTTTNRIGNNFRISCHVNAVVANTNSKDTVANFLAIHFVGRFGSQRTQSTAIAIAGTNWISISQSKSLDKIFPCRRSFYPDSLNNLTLAYG